MRRTASRGARGSAIVRVPLGRTRFHAGTNPALPRKGDTARCRVPFVSPTLPLEIPRAGRVSAIALVPLGSTSFHGSGVRLESFRARQGGDCGGERGERLRLQLLN